MATAPAIEPTERSFPVLSDEQRARLKALGKTRPMKRGEVLVAIGTHSPPMFVVERGAIDVVRRNIYGAEPMVRVGPGQFTG